MKKFFKILGGLLLLVIIAGAIFVPTVRFIPLIVYSLVFPITKFELVDNTLIMDGLISSKTPGQMYKIFDEHPDIDTIEMVEVGGSIDDAANLEIALWVAGKDVTTKLGRYSSIASGGTDFFLAGQERIVVDGAEIGVHAWAGIGGITAKDFPRDHELHQPYIEYYEGVGFSTEDAEDFYYFTIDAAPAEDIHIMSNTEIVNYQLTTTDITEPEFIVPAFEEERQKDGLPYMTEAQAEEAGIEIITKAEYKARQKARNAIKL